MCQKEAKHILTTAEAFALLQVDIERGTKTKLI